jgi:hypothetical protein
MISLTELDWGKELISPVCTLDVLRSCPKLTEQQMEKMKRKMRFFFTELTPFINEVSRFDYCE